MLIAKSLSKQYPAPGGALAVLQDVSLEVNRGESVAIMGPSGCGKSTLLYVLGALEPPTSGTVTLDGTDPYSLGERAQAAFRGSSIGFVFQDHLLLPQLSALDNVLAPTLAAPELDRRTIESHARDLLSSVGLADRLDHRPGELSGGERQRVAIARALVRKPALVLCDEPTGNLDRTSAESIAGLLAGLTRDAGVMLVVVTHSPALAARFQRRYEVDDRRLVPMA